MKTNSKEFTQKIENYILEIIQSNDVALNTIQKKLDFCREKFEIEFNHEYNKKRYPNTQKRVAEWLMGLPISIEYENYRIIELAKEWGSIPNDASEKLEDIVISNWFNLVAFKLIRLSEKFGVKYN